MIKELLYIMKKHFKEYRDKKQIDSLSRIIIDPDLCFTDEEFYKRINSLTEESMRSIKQNFSTIVDKVISLSAKGKEIYIECIGTAGEHFVTTLKIGGKY